MVPDSQTNFLYLADSLPRKFDQFSRALECILSELSIPFTYLPGTKDVWARDYMPVQRSKDDFIQFVYNPDYLQEGEWQGTVTNVDAVTSALQIQAKKSTLKIDGGNIVGYGRKAVLTDKIFSENKHLNRKHIEQELKELLLLDEIIILPRQPYDYIGHADGMVRFLNDETVLINDYSRESQTFQKALYRALDKALLNRVRIPYNPYCNKTSLQASGTYVNYLHMQQAILVPTFGLPEDDIALESLKAAFPHQVIAGIPCNEVANEGGVLNCISWTVMR